MKVKKITASNFQGFGKIIDYSLSRNQAKKNLFCIVLSENRPVGWRVAYLVLRDKKIDTMEAHPDTYETFEPVKGKSLIYLATSKNKSRIECFLLDRPVILKKGIWHAVVTLGKESEIKITENASVKLVYWKLDNFLK
ncbi:MAG: hypothetical protein MUF05_05745 [Candidatus Omnitrophica bacterium]|jgi:ureidoglycolate hydrolase|nr:hypothetical protein [Candidatus Omnitrophota bacterium]